ncbi:RING-H2 finger protein ATL39-like [Typha angustifolia]|uniref:RING-H2 finger protein ATL39-like n=1 Tax=Typha angustifolia TaxID=59011 RepID=UPI003C2F526F
MSTVDGTTTNTTLAFVGIGLFVAVVLYFIINYVRSDLARLHQQPQPAPVVGRPSLGLDDSAVAALPTFTYRAVNDGNGSNGEGVLVETCSVCLGELEEGEVVRMLPGCKHFFHVQCIDEWLGAHSSCPVCRTDHGPEKLDLATVSLSPPLPQLHRRGFSPLTGEAGTSGVKESGSESQFGSSPSPLTSSRGSPLARAGGQAVEGIERQE